MATSADHDDRDEKDEKDEAAEGEESAEEKDDKPAKAEAGRDDDEGEAPAKVKGRAKAAKPTRGKAADDDEAADEEEEEAEGGEEEEEEEAPAPKAVAKRPGAGRGPGAARARKAPAQPQGGGSLGKSVLLFFVIVIGLGVGFVVLGQEKAQPVTRPKWKTGDTTELEITLVHTDRTDLACASAEEIAGKHCAFEAANKPWSKGSNADEKLVFKPYTTVDGMQFAAAGVWSDPVLVPGKVPTVGRFSVKCKYKVEGSFKSLAVRWHDGEQFFPNNNEWYAGSISDCKLSN